MRIVFLGTPDFAVPALQKLLDHSYDIGCVFTQPDRPSGRGQRLRPGRVKIFARDKGIPIFQPEKIRSEENRAIFNEIRPDYIIAVAYGQIVPGWLLRSARLAPINIHASLLPRYRGAAPIPWAILNGDSVTGVTTMVMQETLDSGPILLQQETTIALDKTAGDLAAELSILGADLLIRTLDGLEKKSIEPIVQDESRVSWAPSITKEMARISWHRPALEIHNRIRAMNPWPVAYTDFRGKRLQIWRSSPQSQLFDATVDPGTLLGFSESNMCVQCGDGTVLNVLEVQVPGKGRVNGREFANGARLRVGETIFQS